MCDYIHESLKFLKYWSKVIYICVWFYIWVAREVYVCKWMITMLCCAILFVCFRRILFVRIIVFCFITVRGMFVSILVEMRLFFNVLFILLIKDE